MLISDFLLLVVENVCALTLICDQDLIKQKVKIVDFKTICNSLDYEQTFSKNMDIYKNIAENYDISKTSKNTF